MSRLMRTSALAAAVLGLTASALPTAATTSHAAKKSACFGKQPTIFSAANGAHLKGTGKNDVIEATGKNVTVNGGGGNDRICVKSAKSVNGGAGDDRIQLVSGTVAGGAGKDAITVLPGSGSVKADGGAGPNTFTVPSSRLLATAIAFHSGDAINGTFARVDAPPGAPSFDIGYSGRTGPSILYTERRPLSGIAPYDGSSLTFYQPLAANGRTLMHWAVTFGDNTPALGGNGGPPSYLPHLFIATGAHTIIATVTDSLGVSTTRTQVVNVAFRAASPGLTQSGGNVTTSAAKTFTTSYTPGQGAAARSWYFRFGDGSSTGGSGAPPTTVAHTYAVPGSYYAELEVVDDHGDLETSTSFAGYYPTAVPTPAFDLVDRSGRFHVENATGSPDLDLSVAPGGSAPAGQEIEIYDESLNAQLRSVDWGDGSTGTETYHYYTTAATPVTRTVTVHYVDPSGNALPPVTRTFTVAPLTWHVSLVPPAHVLSEGPVTFSTAGSVLPAAGTFYWYLNWQDGSAPVVGYGPLPATLSHTFASQTVYPELYLYPDDADSIGSEPAMTFTSTAPRVAYFGGNENGDWVPTTSGPDTANGSAVSFSATVVPSLGAHVASGALAYGDGQARDVTPDIGAGYLNYDQAPHGYTTPGEYVATLTVKDSHGKTSGAVNHVSVAGSPTVTAPLTLAATHAVPVTLPLSGITPGANAQALFYDITWDDSVSPTNPDTFNYGAAPANPTHTFASAGTYRVTVTVYNDHGGSTTTTTQISVS